METHWKIITILSFAVTFFGGLGAFSESIITPDIKISTNFELSGNVTISRIEIQNVGLEPATSVRITINPQYEITDYKILYYTEEVNFRLEMS